MIMLKTIIFDMDGVIIDSEPQHAKAAVRTFKELGADVDIEYCYSFIGSSTKKMAETAIKDFSLDISTDELLEKLNKTKKEMHEKSHRFEIEHGDFFGYRVNEICFFISLLPLPG